MRTIGLSGRALDNAGRFLLFSPPDRRCAGAVGPATGGLMQHHVRTGLRRFIGAALAALFVAIALAGPVSAATTGSLSGTVTDLSLIHI